jgi:hypothetical protein
MSTSFILKKYGAVVPAANRPRTGVTPATFVPGRMASRRILSSTCRVETLFPHLRFPHIWRRRTVAPMYTDVRLPKTCGYAYTLQVGTYAPEATSNDECTHRPPSTLTCDVVVVPLGCNETTTSFLPLQPFPFLRLFPCVRKRRKSKHTPLAESHRQQVSSKATTMLVMASAEPFPPKPSPRVSATLQEVSRTWKTYFCA